VELLEAGGNGTVEDGGRDIIEEGVVVPTMETGVAGNAVVVSGGGFEEGVEDWIAWIAGLFSRACN